ncbi:hypothetical protein COY27_03490 [Candidatus Woesearchaeota archaeon CG_4_10_14_0_2_um_filter_33_13]|nr:MAG: hypothetical protein COY27_03490 [Candidatus Woesearchaeota archaeon CG_4_10_14_0_2_um_filter_33_13]
MRTSYFQSILKKKRIDLAFLVHPDPYVTYFTKKEWSYSLLLIKQSNVQLFTTKLDQLPKIKGIIVKELTKDWNKKLPKSVKVVGLNYSSVTVSVFKKIKSFFPKAKFIDLSKELGETREIKTRDEIKAIKKACVIADNAFQGAIKQISLKKLHTEKEVATYIEAFIRSKGAEPSFPTIVAGGKNAAVPHYVTGKDKLQRGFLLFDLGAKIDNYCSDLSRTIFLGIPTKEEKKIYNILLEAQKSAFSSAKEGLLFGDLDIEVRKKLGQYSSNFIHSLGHGVGIEIHERPNFLMESKQQIKQNQVFTIEPGIYFYNKFGIRIEDTVVFNKKVVALTKSPKELIILPR